MAKDPKTGKQIKEVAAERLRRLREKDMSQSAKNIRNRNEYEKAGGMSRGTKRKK